MNVKIKKLYFISLGIALTAAAFFLMEANASKQNGKKFGDWTVICPAPEKTTTDNSKDPSKLPKTPAQPCYLSQQITAEQDGKQHPLAFLQVGYYGEKKTLQMIQTLSLDFKINLKAGTSIIHSKDTLIIPGSYVTCSNKGCVSVGPIIDEDLKLLLSNDKKSNSSKEHSLLFMTMSGQQVSLPISTKGLDKGLNYIK